MTRCTSQQRNLINHVWRKDFYPIKKKTKGGVGLVIRQQVLKEGQNGAPGQRGRWQGKAGHRPGAHLPGAPSGSGSWHPTQLLVPHRSFRNPSQESFYFALKAHCLEDCPPRSPSGTESLVSAPRQVETVQPKAGLVSGLKPEPSQA